MTSLKNRDDIKQSIIEKYNHYCSHKRSVRRKVLILAPAAACIVICLCIFGLLYSNLFIYRSAGLEGSHINGVSKRIISVTVKTNPEFLDIKFTDTEKINALNNIINKLEFEDTDIDINSIDGTYYYINYEYDVGADRNFVLINTYFKEENNAWKKIPEDQSDQIINMLEQNTGD